MVLAQLAVFAMISVLVVAYASVNLLGVHVTNGPYPVTVQLATGGGIFDGADVTYRGVHVGRVGHVALQTGGVTVTLSLDHGSRVPDDAIAHVYDLSAVGEQYIDLVPQGHSGGLLHAGSVIRPAQTTTPLQTATVLYDLERFVDSIDPRDVQVFGREGAAAFSGTGPQLQQLLSDATTIVSELSSTSGSTVDLIHNAALLLHTAQAHSGDFSVFARSADQLSATLAGSTPTLDQFLREAAPATQAIDQLIRQNASPLTLLLANGALLSQIQVVRIPGLKSLLVAVPEFGVLSPTVVHDGALLGAADVNLHQPDCPTGVPLTSPISGIRTPVRPVSCPQDILPRGAANAPVLGGSDSAGATGADSVQVAGYDPSTGLVTTSDGTMLRLGTNGEQRELLGADAWRSLLLPPGDG